MISIVVPLFNNVAASQRMLSSLLTSLSGYSEYEIVLIDDASTDSTAGWLAGLDDMRIRCMKNAKNLGYAKSVNAAAACCTGAVLVLANNDLVFSDDWLQPMLDLLEDTSLNAGAIGNVQLRVSDCEIDHAGFDLNYRGQLEHIRILPSREKTYTESFVVTGACCMVRTSDFRRLNGYNESYLNGCEDVDLCLRLAELGYTHYVALRSQVLHHVSLTRVGSRIQDEKNSDLLFRSWAAKFEEQLARRWLELAGDSILRQPSDGAEELGIDLAALQRNPAFALRLARSLLARNDLHRKRFLQFPPEAQVSKVSISPPARTSDILSHGHLVGRTRIIAAARQGLDGLYLNGHFFAVTHPSDSVRICIEVNRIQRRTVVLAAGGFSVGIDRPAVWVDEESTIEVWVEQSKDDAWYEALPEGAIYSDLYFANLRLDGTTLPLA